MSIQLLSFIVLEILFAFKFHLYVLRPNPFLMHLQARGRYIFVADCTKLLVFKFLQNIINKSTDMLF
jgi:hypothetical protein